MRSTGEGASYMSIVRDRKDCKTAQVECDVGAPHVNEIEKL